MDHAGGYSGAQAGEPGECPPSLPPSPPSYNLLLRLASLYTPRDTRSLHSHVVLASTLFVAKKYGTAMHDAIPTHKAPPAPARSTANILTIHTVAQVDGRAKLRRPGSQPTARNPAGWGGVSTRTPWARPLDTPGD